MASPPGMPIVGVDYPGTWAEFRTKFSSDVTCIAYLERLRWPDGIVCPGCGSRRGWRAADGRWSCSNCARRVSATAGTIFDRTRTSLQEWFAAAWYVTSAKQGASALGLQRTLGLGSYQTAWSMLHKLRTAMVRPHRERLSGTVEVDETLVGGIAHGKRGRGAARKSIVVIAVEVLEPKGFGRIRMRHVPDATGASLCPFVEEVVEKGSTIITDGWTGYYDLPLHLRHRKLNIKASSGPAHVSLPAVHRIASLFKRWLLGTHQGSVDPRHLQAYLEEFTFRFNRRTSRRRGLLFYRLLELAVDAPPRPYRAIVARNRHHKG
jgi:transposase-like protein